MKQPAAYYLLLLYCTVLVRCAIPVVCDTLSHVFNEEEHVATIHAIYGSNHMEKEIASQEKDSNKNQTFVKYDDQVPVHLSIKEYSFTAYTVKNLRLSYCFMIPKIKTVFLPKQIHPPKFS